MGAARAAVYDLLTLDFTLNTLGINPNTVFQTNTVDDPPTRPFVVIRWEVKTGFLDNHGPQNLSIWAHDERGDYERVDDILFRVETILLNAVHIVGADGNILTSAEYLSSSEDLYDDGYQTITRYSTFRTLSRASS